MNAPNLISIFWKLPAKRDSSVVGVQCHRYAGGWTATIQSKRGFVIGDGDTQSQAILAACKKAKVRI